MSSVAHSQNLNPSESAPSQDASLSAPSESLPNQNGPVISKISFIGLKRTKESFLQDSLKSYIGKRYNSKSKSNLESDLQAMNLFSSIEFSSSFTDGGTVELNINVKEKIAFIPLPFAMYSSSTGFMVGGFVMDMNAGGQKDMFVTGLLWSPNNTMVLGLYSHAPRIGAPGFRVHASASKQNAFFRNAEGDELLKIENFNAGLGTAILFKLDRYNNLDCGLTYQGFFPYDTDVHPDAYRRNKFGANTGWKISDQNWNGVFLSETSFGLNGGLYIDTKAHLTESLSASVKVQQPLIPKLRLNVLSGAGIVFNGLITDNLQKGTACVTILDDKFSSPKIAGAASGLEFAVFQHRKIGTISIYGNYEFVFAQEFDDSLLFCQGFNVGSKVYLSGLAFPAVSMGLAYNATKNKFYFAGSFGVSF
ncbi:POTRA domain-containing protein [Treponema sp. C6A8]|uniref:outer membrane protein assembly factor n=1 Tax=Treponema sp. C6A8 TaxID=1410609 RepID=UPI00056DD1B4|nr:POTRA domain-containing protein [Treponema sp. C6A8]